MLKIRSQGPYTIWEGFCGGANRNGTLGVFFLLTDQEGKIVGLRFETKALL